MRQRVGAAHLLVGAAHEAHLGPRPRRQQARVELGDVEEELRGARLGEVGYSTVREGVHHCEGGEVVVRARYTTR